MDAVGDVERTGNRDGISQIPGPAGHARRERLRPGIGLLAHPEHACDLGQVALQLAGVDGPEPLQHLLPALLALVEQVLPQMLAGCSLDELPLREILDERDGDIDLALRAERPPDAAHATPRARGHGAWHLHRTERKDLAQPARGHTALVQRLDLSVHRARQMTAERPQLPLERCGQRMRECHVRMSVG